MLQPEMIIGMPIQTPAHASSVTIDVMDVQLVASIID